MVLNPKEKQLICITCDFPPQSEALKRLRRQAMDMDAYSKLSIFLFEDSK